MKENNLFNSTPEMRKRFKNVIKHNLELHGNTVIPFSMVEKYSIDHIKNQLSDAGYECEIKICLKGFEPDNIEEVEYVNNHRVKVQYPIMPAVIVTWSGYKDKITEINNRRKRGEQVCL